MKLRVRRAVRTLAALALLAAPPVHANVTGNLELQSQTTQSSSGPGGGTTQSTLLMESLALHYAGLPLGSDVALATAGGAYSNVRGWLGNGLQSSGQVISFDASVGFLPRRAVPLRIYGGGSFDAGTAGALAVRGAGPSFLFGGALNLEPGASLPGLRLDASESRSSRPEHANGSDVQRRLVASTYGTVAGQRLNLGARLESDHRDGAGDIASRGATLNWTSSLHQTTFLASDVRRSLPTLAGITSDRLLSGTSDQRWSNALSTQLGARLSEAAADVEGGTASGSLGDARASFTWVPIQAPHQLTLSAGANGGFTRSSSPERVDPTDPASPLTIREASGKSYGAGGRAGYARPLGPVTGGLAAGASVNTFDCTTRSTPGTPGSGAAQQPAAPPSCGIEGSTTVLDATASLALVPGSRASAQVEYTIARAIAPPSRGGDRLENHARGIGRLGFGYANNLNASLGYDDGVRELLDITTGQRESVHERAITGSLGAGTRLGGISLSTEVRHVRGLVVTEGSLFVAGPVRQVRSSTSASASAGWSPWDTLALQAQAIGARTTLEDAADFSSFGANVALSGRLGRILLNLQYQVTRVQLINSSPSFQQSIRSVLSRPFELY